MKRHRRTRRIQRRGVQHIGDLLSVLVDEIEQQENDSAHAAAQPTGRSMPITATAPVTGQATFSFYETVGG